MVEKIKTVAIVALAVLLIIFLNKGCNDKKAHDNLLEQISHYKLGEQAFKVKHNADSSTIATQQQTILTEREAKRLGLVKYEGEIKKLKAQIIQSQQIKYGTIAVPFTPNGYADTTGWYKKLQSGDTSKAICDSLKANSVVVPKAFSKHDKWFNIDGKVVKEGVNIESIVIPNESTVSIGWKKAGFLHLKKVPIVEVKNTNPYMDVTKMSNIIIDPKKGLFQKNGFWIGVGAAIVVILKLAVLKL